MAKPMAVLPLLASSTILPDVNSPAASACSIIFSAMRSLTEPPGFNPSSFTSTSTPGTRFRRLIRTRGVFPTNSRTELTLRGVIALSLTNHVGSRPWASSLPCAKEFRHNTDATPLNLLDCRRVSRYVSFIACFCDTVDGKKGIKRAICGLPDGSGCIRRSGGKARLLRGFARRGQGLRESWDRFSDLPGTIHPRTAK